MGEESCEGKACLHLTLAASRKGLSYQRIELWLGKAHHEPISADLYVLSEKLAKQARFVLDKAAAPTMVTEMVLLGCLAIVGGAVLAARDLYMKK